MISVLDKKMTILDEALNDVLITLDNFSSEALSYKPGSDKWNSVQILFHLQQSENASLSYLRKKIPQIDDQFRTGFKEQYRSFLLRFFLATPLKFKAPAAFASLPDDLNYNDVKKDYLVTRRGIRDCMENIKSDQADRAVMKHPRIGRINAVQTLDFLGAHFDHHRKQIEARLVIFK